MRTRLFTFDSGGGKGAAIGAGVGAGVGFIAKKLKKGDEAKVKEGTEFGVILNRRPVRSDRTDPNVLELLSGA